VGKHFVLAHLINIQMQRKFLVFLCVGVFCILSATISIAQITNPAATQAPPTLKKPNVKTYWGATVTGTLQLTAAAAAQLFSQPIRIIDDKNVGYLISSYQFAYKRIGITEDEVTGKISPQSEIVANRFYSAILPLVWQNNIKETLQKGEELYFFDIVVISSAGFRFYAPDLKITII
jgi:hypothetical protein